MKITRIRYIITQKNETEVMCGLARQYHFKKIDEVGNTAVKTYHSRKKAESAFLRSWNRRTLDDIDVIRVKEEYIAF